MPKKQRAKSASPQTSQEGGASSSASGTVPAEIKNLESLEPEDKETDADHWKSKDLTYMRNQAKFYHNVENVKERIKDKKEGAIFMIKLVTLKLKAESKQSP